MEWQKLSIASVTVNGESLCETYTKRQIKKKTNCCTLSNPKIKNLRKLDYAPVTEYVRDLEKCSGNAKTLVLLLHFL